MFKVNGLISLFLIITSFNAYAEDGGKSSFTLPLQCNIAFTNFDNIEHASTSAVITLTELKHKRGGFILVFQTANYEFWVMTHGVQTINDRQFVNNFQVAIKHKASKLFMHALSDSSHTPETPPRHARISIVDYYPDSSLEKGELSFECHSIE